MPDPYTLRHVRIAYVTILGRIWMPAIVCSQHLDLSDYDLRNIGEFTRENVEDWLSRNAGDFQEVIDFEAVCGEEAIEWSSEENYFQYCDTIQECED